MATYGNPASMAAPRSSASHHHAAAAAAYGAPVAMHAPAAPAGTFAPGTKIQVGEHRVVITKYLSEGGFAHVYLVKLPRPVDGTDQAVLKRVAVPDRDTLRGMRTEVETMKRLKGHRPIVRYIDSHASEMKGGGYEVFLLMEFCDGGGLIDFMNTRLQHRLTEPEILNIFTDVAEGVACMHYLKPPLLHRDLKVENVLITMIGSRRKFKLCDFGSAAPPKPAPQTVVECRLMDEDVQRHTTLQYRSPEMVDVYRKQPIDEKSDIWALGVLLYKLCYYTTPFEEQGQLAILNASFRFPSYPVFSDRLKHLIASMLREHQQQRPNIYQVLREGCQMQGKEVPIQDIYSGRSPADTRTSEMRSPDLGRAGSTPVVGAVFSPPPVSQPKIPEVTPMRRGRPPAGAAQPQPPQQVAKPSPSPMRVTSGDPFAALDSKTGRRLDTDEASARFPSLDQFSILHDQGAKFDFDSPTSPQHPQDNFGKIVTDALADEAFSRPQAVPTVAPAPSHRQSADLNRIQSIAAANEMGRPSPPPGPASKAASAPPKPVSREPMSRASAIISNNPELQAISPPPQSTQPPPGRPGMVSIGTMTSTPPPPADLSQRDFPPIHRFPPSDNPRSSSVPRQPDALLKADAGPSSRPIAGQRVSSFQSPSMHARQPSSSRPSLEGGRPSADLLEPLSKSTSVASRPRPASTYLESNLDYLREREAAPRPLRSPGLGSSKQFEEAIISPPLGPQEESVIESNVDFLRSMEESDNKKKEKSLKHGKRSSLSSLSGKNIFAGKFGDAFKRFESSNPLQPARTPSPLKELDRRDLTPIAGSEATDGRSDDGRTEAEELTPEQRRDLEAQALAEEERRVEAAAAEYRQRMASRDTTGGTASLPKSIGGVSRAVSIQNRVQNLLEESQRPAAVQRTAEGYGRFTDTGAPPGREKQLPELPRKPVSVGAGRGGGAGGGSGGGAPVKPTSSSADVMARARSAGGATPNAMPDASAAAGAAPRPVAPPKPTHLNKLPTGGHAASPPKQHRSLPSSGGGPSAAEQQLVGLGLDMTPQEKEDYLQDFSKRFPSLNAIEMVERDLGTGEGHKSVR